MINYYTRSCRNCIAHQTAIVVVSMLVIVSLSAPALAELPQTDQHVESESTALADIVVTARKRSENVQDVPESVAVVGAKQLENAHVQKTDDLGNLVSNLNITTRFDHTPDVVLRGVGAFGVTRGVGFYADDVQLFDGQTVQLDDLDRIEVLKGPQGTLYGGSNIGGAIKYISKLPTDDFEGKASLEYGNYRTETTSAFVSGPLIPGVLSGRVSGFYTNTDGYIYDPTLGRTLDRGNEYSSRGIFKYTADTTTAVLYLYADRIHTGAENLYYTPASATAYSYDATDDTRPLFQRSIYSATLDVQKGLAGGLQLTSISSFFEAADHLISDIDKGPYPFLAYYAHSRQTVGSEELRLQNTDGQRLRWLVGAFFQGNDTPNNFSDSRSFNGDPGDTAEYTNPAEYSDQYANPEQKHRDYALFSNAMYSLDRWSLEAGIRFDHNNSSMTDRVNDIAQKQSNTMVMPKVSVSFRPRDQVLAYATIARGFEPGDLTESADAAGNPDIVTYHPETALSYELGIKSTPSDRLRLNAALFYTDYRNRLFQSNRLELGQFVNETVNIGSSTNYGLEVEASSRITEDLRLDANIGVTRSVWGNVPYFDPDANNSLVNLKGLVGPNTPGYLSSVSLDWSHHLSAAAVLGARIDVTAIGRQYWDVTNHYYQPAYQLINLGARCELGRWELSSHVSNVFNTSYNTAFISAAEVGAPHDIAGIGRPRIWSAKISFRF